MAASNAALVTGPDGAGGGWGSPANWIGLNVSHLFQRYSPEELSMQSRDRSARSPTCRTERHIRIEAGERLSRSNHPVISPFIVRKLQVTMYPFGVRFD